MEPMNLEHAVIRIEERLGNLCDKQDEMKSCMRDVNDLLKLHDNEIRDARTRVSMLKWAGGVIAAAVSGIVTVVSNFFGGHS